MAQHPSPSMMAWRVHEFGPPDVMRYERIARPDPCPGDVLVKVEAAGVGPWDGWIRAGKSALPQPLPLTLGSDLAGEVVAAGQGVARPHVGERVYGVTNAQFLGAYAEYAVASAAMVSSKPTSLGFIEAASVPVIAVTAGQALFHHAQLTAGQTVVIHGAAGNVGAYAVQFARRAGLHTIATAAAALLHSGVVLDVLGKELDEFPSDLRERIVARYPRKHFKEGFIETHFAGFAHKPATTYGTVNAGVYESNGQHMVGSLTSRSKNPSGRDTTFAIHLSRPAQRQNWAITMISVT